MWNQIHTDKDYACFITNKSILCAQKFWEQQFVTLLEYNPNVICGKSMHQIWIEVIDKNNFGFSRNIANDVFDYIEHFNYDRDGVKFEYMPIKIN